MSEIERERERECKRERESVCKREREKKRFRKREKLRHFGIYITIYDTAVGKSAG